jgi:O-acetyl-ADP-ribose deacetylase (regulator of RNase III)
MKAARAAARKRDVRTCFAIMPFSIKPDPARGDRVNFDHKVYNGIIGPAVQLVSRSGIPMKVTRADKISRAGSIHERMIELIATADVAIVDITLGNANVFYELGVRHALRDRVTVLIRRRGTKNPFNIGGLVSIEYDEKKPLAARRAIAAFVRNGLQSSARDSLVYSILPDLRIEPPRGQDLESGLDEYEIPDAEGRRIGIVSGDLRHANLNDRLRSRPIDVWVNSENINMAMARPQEGNLSGLIRYLGARKDETGTIVEDVIANELKEKMGRRQVVNPGEVVATDAGRLRETHHVKQIFHAASVYGVVGSGFHPIAKIEQCIVNALARMDFDPETQPRRSAGRNTPKADLESILFPLLGSGTARADLIQSARTQMKTAVSYLRSRAGFTRVKRVYFLAPTQVHLAALRVALAELKITKQLVPPAGATRRR